MKTWQKIAVSVIATAAVFCLFGLITIFAFLPDPAELGRSLQALRTSPAPNAPTNVVSTAPANPQVKDAATAATTAAQSLGAPASPVLSPAPTPSPAERKRIAAERFVERYLSEDRIQSEVCENLAVTTPPFKNVDEFGKQVEASLLGEQKLSSAAEAIMMPLEYTLKNEAVRELVRSVENAAARGDTSFVQKAQFYAQAARATASVYASREELEAVSGHAYRLHAIGRAAALKPEILNDPETGDLCRGMQRSVTDQLPRDPAFDRERLARLLNRHSIDPSSIDYDPEMSTQVRLGTENGAMKVELPWLERVLKTRE